MKALQNGTADSGIFVTSLDLPWVTPLFTDPNLEVTHLALAEALRSLIVFEEECCPSEC